jgi:hypothetical protein
MRSSGDLLADRRYVYAKAAFDEGDWIAAADLARQALELAPDFAVAWFLLGEACGQVASTEPAARQEAIHAFQAARRLDPDDVLGSGLRLALLGAEDPGRAMSLAYVRSLFDEYAIRFDRHLRQSLAYRGPELLHDAVRRACSLELRPFRFEMMLDLGCGTGLAAEAFRPECRRIAGVDLSPAMVRKADAKRALRRRRGGRPRTLAREPVAGRSGSRARGRCLRLSGRSRAGLPGRLAGAAPGGLFAFTSRRMRERASFSGTTTATRTARPICDPWPTRCSWIL